MLREPKEVLTLFLMFICYALWLAALGLSGEWNPIIVIVMLSVSIGFHSSLQHEVLHGHPFKNQALSDALVFPAIGLFVPYQRFRDTHIAHHQDSVLTDPYDDPESNYLDPAVWARLPGWLRRVHLFNNTLAGRLIAGPLISMIAFTRADWRAVQEGDKAIIKAWCLHALGLVPVFGMVMYFDAPIWLYFLGAYFGFSLIKIRTFLEHRAHEAVAGRTVIIEDRGPLALLFLNNNYHVVHHAHPALPWYALPAKFEQGRENYLDRNRHYYYRNYAQIFAKFFCTRKDDVPHPFCKGKK